MNNISLPNIAVPGDFEYHMVGRVKAHSTLVRNVAVSLGATEVAIPISAVQSIVIMT